MGRIMSDLLGETVPPSESEASAVAEFEFEIAAQTENQARLAHTLRHWDGRLWIDALGVSDGVES